MKIVAEYRERAEQCEHMARLIASPEQRHKILKIAASWRALADERERNLQGRAAA